VLNCSSFFAAGFNSIVLYGSEPPANAQPPKRGGGNSILTSDLALLVGLILAVVVFVAVVIVIVRLLRKRDAPVHRGGYSLTPGGESARKRKNVGQSKWKTGRLLSDLMDSAH